MWYYSDAPFLPRWLEQARTRPIMQYTAEKLDEWFVPGAPNKLLARDRAASIESMKIFQNLINPAVSGSKESDTDTGYKSSERTALENQLLQIETAARAEEANTPEPADVIIVE